jgi:hypothetical protein
MTGTYIGLTPIRRIFNDSERYIYVPNSKNNSKSGLWFRSEECIWSGPEWLSIPILSPIDVYKQLKELFVDILEIRNSEIHDYLEHLQKMKVNDSNSLEENMNPDRNATLVYKHLAHSAKINDENMDKI